MKCIDAPEDFIEWLPVNCNISDASLADCVARLGPARVYTMYCGKRAFEEMRAWLRHTPPINHSPFAPQINVCVEPTAKPDEWVLEAMGKRVGSHGVSW